MPSRPCRAARHHCPDFDRAGDEPRRHGWRPPPTRGPATRPPAIAGVPIDFILFGLTLLGVALFHHHTLRVAVAGLAVITLFKALVLASSWRPVAAGFISHLAPRMGDPRQPASACCSASRCSSQAFRDKPRARRCCHAFLPTTGRAASCCSSWCSCLSSFLDNIAAALIGGTMATHAVPRQGPHRLPRRDRRRLERRRLGQRRRRHDDDDDVDRRRAARSQVLEAYVAAERRAARSSAFPRRCSSTRYSPIVKDAPPGIARRLGCASASSPLHPRRGDRRQRRRSTLGSSEVCSTSLPFIGARGRGSRCSLVAPSLRRPTGSRCRGDLAAASSCCRLVLCASMMPVREAAGGIVAGGARPGLRLGGVRQHPAHRAGA